ncbi:hypothetical protein [Polyangium spumosum]|uniref:Lipoprotein n=1 Tax=Polyangium spumosum TaxID=889282 RepID=A0A6N7PZB3_9BACT|nr:hypothetical protein [Polyangium spumosum]MRG97562.1 hypothetical protein [Polyangium spumosum]
MTRLRFFLLAPFFLLGCANEVREVVPPAPTPEPLCAEPLDLVFGSAESRTPLVGLSVAVDGSCNTYLAGMTEGPIDFGGGPVGETGAPFAFVAKLDPQGKHLWSRALPVGASFPGKDVIAVHAQGRVLVAGSLHADVDFGGGPLGGEYVRAEHPFLLELDADGHHVWSRRLHGNLPDDLDYEGNFHRAIEGVSFDAEGHFVITGRFLGHLDLGGVTLMSTPQISDPFFTNYKPDVFVARYDTSGGLVWAKRFGGDVSDFPAGLDVSPSGDTVVLYTQFSEMESAGEPAGLHVKRFSPGGDVVWSKVFEGSALDPFGGAVALSDDGGLVLGGQGILTWPGIGMFGEAFVGRIDSKGEPMLAASLTGGSAAVVSGVAPDGSGGIRAVGFFDDTLLVHGKAMASSSGGLDVFDAHLEWDDAANTTSTFGDATDEVALAMAGTKEGTRVIVGVRGPLVHDLNEHLSPYSKGSRIFLRRR